MKKWKNDYNPDRGLKGLDTNNDYTEGPDWHAQTDSANYL